MYSIITGSLVLSLLHAVIPNHWLPVIAVGRKERWSLPDITRVTFVAALAHAVSTILIGVLLAGLGLRMSASIGYFTSIIAPSILVVLGLFFIYRHHRHKHFQLRGGLDQKQSKASIITALVVAMLLSPCMEIEAYFLLAGTISRWLVGVIALMYFVITTSGMVLLVRYAYMGILKLNWHSLEHNAGIITGITLVITGILTFFFQ
jgi:nickel/cobalt exporter